VTEAIRTGAPLPKFEASAVPSGSYLSYLKFLVLNLFNLSKNKKIT
jgi:hypothetical protein